MAYTIEDFNKVFYETQNELIEPKDECERMQLAEAIQEHRAAIKRHTAALERLDKYKMGAIPNLAKHHYRLMHDCKPETYSMLP